MSNALQGNSHPRNVNEFKVSRAKHKFNIRKFSILGKWIKFYATSMGMHNKIHRKYRKLKLQLETLPFCVA